MIREFMADWPIFSAADNSPDLEVEIGNSAIFRAFKSTFTAGPEPQIQWFDR
jgi:hypothetical protein